MWPNGKAPRLGRGDWEFESLHLDQFNAGIAQMVEQWFCKPQVAGSIPAAGTINNSAGVVHRKSVEGP